MNFMGEARKWLRWTYSKCFERQDIPHLCWSFLNVEL